MIKISSVFKRSFLVMGLFMIVVFTIFNPRPIQASAISLQASWQKTTNYAIGSTRGKAVYPIASTYWHWTTNVWDGPKFYRSAYWEHYGGVTQWWFKARVFVPLGTTSVIMRDPYKSGGIIPINDDLYVYVNGKYMGARHAGGARNMSMCPESDGWYDSPLNLSSAPWIQGAWNDVGILVEEIAYWGGMGYLEFQANAPIAPELLPNPSFTTNDDSWYSFADNTAQVIGERDALNYDSGPAGYRIQCIAKGNGPESIQLFTMPLTIVQDKIYMLTFRAKCSSNFSIPSINLMKATSPWNVYATPYHGLSIGATVWKTYAVIFKANATANDGRITFFLGGALPEGALFHIDTLSLKEVYVNPFPPAGELLSNPGFDMGIAGWSFYSDPTAQAKGCLDPSDFDIAPASYRIECTQSGSSVNAVQLFTMPFNIEANKKYKLTFKAKCSSSFAIPSIRLMKATSPWTLYDWPCSGLVVSNNWQSYSYTFTANTTASDGRLTFFLGNALPPGSVFWIDSLSLREVGM
ncbi:MAG: carbohydrate binding domain-containing protein [Firmicutes bacterium]|nr:carbohydrate binding domain-containing protein [Bacillota bacterium]